MKIYHWGRKLLKRVPLVSQLASRRQAAALQKQTPEEIFTGIYLHNRWGGDVSLSGTGSDEHQTRRIVEALPAMFAEYSIRSMLDIPCGDFHWMQTVDLHGVNYLGGDIVEEMIAKNQKYSRPGVAFRKLNLLADALPETDLIICRDCLVHFSNDDVFRALKNIAASNTKYLLTTTFPAREQNASIATGQWRPLNLQREPFCLPAPIKLIAEECTEFDGEFSDKSLGLWKVDALLS